MGLFESIKKSVVERPKSEQERKAIVAKITERYEGLDPHEQLENALKDKEVEIDPNPETIHIRTVRIPTKEGTRISMSVAELSTADMIGNMEARAAAEMRLKGSELREKIYKISDQINGYFKLVQQEHEKMEGLESVKPKNLKEFVEAEELAAKFERFTQRFKKEPLFDEKRFLIEQVRAAASAPHDAALVERFHSEEIEQLYQTYSEKISEYEKRIKKLQSSGKSKSGMSPYR